MESLPHARGGVSAAFHVFTHWSPSSPRPWGCFDSLKDKSYFTKVFPTPVGVFPDIAYRR